MLAAWNNERPGAWTNDSLRNVLLALNASNPPAQQTAMREIVQHFGWPTRTMVGAQGAAAAMQIAMRNPPLQAEALRLMRALPAAEVQQDELATLDDIVHVSRNEPQLYATQLKPDTIGMSEFYPVDSLFRIGERRAAVGLPPMSVYLCMIRAATRHEAKFPPPEFSTATPVPKFRPYWRPHAVANGGWPQAASVALGGMYVLWRASDATKWSGLQAIAEPGVEAGKFRLGYGSSDRNGVGVSGTLSLLNYWGHGEWLQPSRMYAGYEVHVSARHFDVGVGQYQSLRYGKLRFAGSVGFGL